MTALTSWIELGTMSEKSKTTIITIIIIIIIIKKIIIKPQREEAIPSYNQSGRQE